MHSLGRFFTRKPTYLSVTNTHTGDVRAMTAQPENGLVMLAIGFWGTAKFGLKELIKVRGVVVTHRKGHL